METVNSDPLVRPTTFVMAVVLGLGLMWGLDAYTREPEDAMVTEAKIQREFAVAPSRRGAPAPERRHVVLDAEGLAAALRALQEMENTNGWEGLRTQAFHGADARVRIAALRGLARRYGRQARGTLLSVTNDGKSTNKVRAEAARLIGTTGEGALPELQRLLATRLPAAVHGGALRGMAAMGTEDSVRAIVRADRRFDRRAAGALREVRTVEAVSVLIDAAGDPSRPHLATAACHALAGSDAKSAAPVLAVLLERSDTPAAMRAAAANALGVLGVRDTLPTVVAACDSPSPHLSRTAQVARGRLVMADG